MNRAPYGLRLVSCYISMDICFLVSLSLRSYNDIVALRVVNYDLMNSCLK